MLKKFLYSFIIIILISASTNFFQANATIVNQGKQITVLLNDQALFFDQPPIIYGGRTLVPLRTIFEALGAKISWEDKTKTVIANKGYINIKLSISHKKGYKNGQALDLDAPPILLDGRIFVPLRFISESFGAIVDWNPDAKTVRITESERSTQDVYEENGIKFVTSVKEGNIASFDGKSWRQRFWRGVNLGVTTPGHYPGELSPSKEDYLRWFRQMKDLNVDLVRVYTILPPYFYEALSEFNQSQQQPLWLMQGIYSPEEEMIGENGKGKDTFSPEIKSIFQNEIMNAVHVIHGKADLPRQPGHASGNYRYDVSQYLMGWLVGTEWYPYAVQVTNHSHAGMESYHGTYFSAKEEASAFESWLTEMLDTLAKEEMKFGWQHPVAFTNWVTTDPLSHPNEPFEEEDMVTVDPLHLNNTFLWKAGYFAAYHVYPYYPDSLRFDEKYQTYIDQSGNINPYAGYLHELRQYHKDIPLMIAEFGVPSSRGMAHKGPLGFNQGMHTEQEQGAINAKLLTSIHQEGYDGGIVFSWHDEWFKSTWNIMDLVLPRDRRAMWFNRLTNEANFGLIAIEPGRSPNELIYLDGKQDDWKNRKNMIEKNYSGFQLKLTHDEGYLYLLLQKEKGSWNFAEDKVDIGFDTLTGGSKISDQAPNTQFTHPIEFLLQLNGPESYIFVNSAYDQHTWLYGHILKSTPYRDDFRYAEKGIFLPWKLALSKKLYLPETDMTIPFEDLDIGKLMPGITDPNHSDYNSLADWYANEGTLEIRIPWMMLGFTDPSTKQAWNYPYINDRLEAILTEGITLEPIIYNNNQAQQLEPILYNWNSWDLPTYHERKKESFYIMRDTFKKFQNLIEY